MNRLIVQINHKDQLLVTKVPVADDFWMRLSDDADPRYRHQVPSLRKQSPFSNSFPSPNFLG
jgi:hypothetical protein